MPPTAKGKSASPSAPVLYGGVNAASNLTVQQWPNPGSAWPYTGNPYSTFNVVWQDTTSNATYCSAASVMPK